MILFYSYYTLEVPNFHQPSPAYLKFPRVAPMDLEALIEAQPVVAGEMAKRYPIYLSGRQFGNWLPRIHLRYVIFQRTHLTEENLQQLPPNDFKFIVPMILISPMICRQLQPTSSREIKS